MAFVILGLAFTTEAMSTFDRMLTATDELWFEIAVDTNHDGTISPEEIAAATSGSISKSLSVRSLRRLDEASRRTMHTCSAAILDDIADGGSSAASGADVAAGAGEQPKGGVREITVAVKVAIEAKAPCDWKLTPYPGLAENRNAAAAVNPAENSNVVARRCSGVGAQDPTGYQKSPAVGTGSGNQLRRPSHSRNGGHWSLWPTTFARKFFSNSASRRKGNTVGAV
jgi:hypothetical protein